MFLSDPFDHTQLCHVLPQLRMLELSVGKGCQIRKLMYACAQVTDATATSILAIYMACVQGMCSREL